MEGEVPLPSRRRWKGSDGSTTRAAAARALKSAVPGFSPFSSFLLVLFYFLFFLFMYVGSYFPPWCIFLLISFIFEVCFPLKILACLAGMKGK